ncbi:MAG: hypothetical protein AAB221_10850, partial [Bacteroidota bacterium]
LTDVDSYIQSKTAEAYRNPRLIANEVLGRNPHTTDYLHKVLFDEDAIVSALHIVWRVVKYYMRGAVAFAIYVITYSIHQLFYRNPDVPFVSSSPLYIVDTFFFIETLLQEGQYHEHCFPGLYDVLQQKNIPFVILPKFLGRLRPDILPRLKSIFEQTGYSFFSELDLLQWTDIVEFFLSLLLYPLDVLILALHTKRVERLDRLFIAEILNTVDYNPSHTFIRYLTGKRIGKIVPQEIYLINWCENQVIDKALFRGLRETKSNVFIYGVQSFIDYPPYLCRHIAKVDETFGMTPDVILANAPAYLDVRPAVAQKIGVSFRSGDLFRQSIHLEEKKQSVIFLPYHRILSNEVIAVCAGVATLRDQYLPVTIHP